MTSYYWFQSDPTTKITSLDFFMQQLQLTTKKYLFFLANNR